MYSLLLVIIYIAFISLGLPDSLLGSAWPVMYEQFDVPISYAGIVTMIIAGGTIVSSLMSDRLTRKLGAGLVTAISVMMTAVALFGFSISGSLIFLCLWAVPYGLGAGAVDAALNNYVALHYASRHMSWLHCFWGVGAAVSPYIMSYCLTSGLGWNNGYRSVAGIQIVLTAILFLSLPLWKRKTIAHNSSETPAAALSLSQALKIKGVIFILFTFFGYCALESTTGLWASSYLVRYRGIDAETAARFASLFFLGITFGRFLSGFIADKVGDKRLIRFGIITIMFGIVLVGLPIGSNITVLLGLVIIGLGCAPVFPSIIHSTPTNFGKENSQAIIGIQMASAYMGSTFMPPLFGLIADHISIGLYPIYLMFFAILMLLMSERLIRAITVKE
ncbi:MFS transporter [Paenibacillus durus]|uniref:MFS transporter n=1 Tax=Paenibacillus durus ATCC 35681 TaxID=1333534 RepID=A0A0F7FCS3_PAEDU|nr:MFS transporter [Paenibacillus durus]AKG36680.1 MFS transporter [Paenibacillus durus ATCC 35681]